MNSLSLVILLIVNEKICLIFYPHVPNDFPDVPATGDGTGANYINKNNEKKIETNVSNKRIKKKANEQSYILPRTNQKK